MRMTMATLHRFGARSAIGAGLALAACARIEPPPGGPPDTAPPRLESTHPEPLAALPGFDGEVEFRFSEVISEGATASQGTGMGDLERLVVLSPTTRVPEVRWRRNRVTVRPREGWQPNTVYRVELLPGITDLRNNRSTEGGTVITFTTGAPIPTDTLRGRVWDWTTGRPAPGALIEAALLPDTLIYRFVADSGGGFALSPLPSGTYLVTAALDPERDRRRTGREPFDSTRITTGTADSLELWMFPHDSTGPRLAEITSTDSLSIRLRFSQLLDPYQLLDGVAVSVHALPDSAPIESGTLLREATFDSLYRTQAPPAADSLPPDSLPADTLTPRDTLRAGPDTTLKQAAAAPPQPSRPTLSDRLMLRVTAPLEPARRYAVVVRGIRNASGTAAEASGVLEVGARAEPAPALPQRPVPTDSTPPPDRK
jgi:hypothetical protein